MEIIGLIGIIIAMILFLVLVYKGCAPYWVVIISTIIVALTNGVGIVHAITETFLEGMAEVILTLFSVVFLGAILGRVYTDTGAASSIARTLTNAFVIKREGKKKVTAAVVVLAVVATLCTLGGIDGYVLTFTMFPICLVIAEMCDIPRRFIPGLLCLNCAFMTAPGSPQIYNIMAEAGLKSQIEHFAEQGAFGIAEELAAVSATSAAIPGLAAMLVTAVGGGYTLIRLINKAKDRGEHFDFGPLKKMDIPDRKLPHFLVSILPLVLVFVLFSIVHLDVFLALGAGIILGFLLMFTYLPKMDDHGNAIGSIRSIVNTLNTGSGAYPNALISVVTPAALAAVITSTAAFGMVIGILGGAQIPATALLIIVICIIVALTSSPPAALMLSGAMFLGVITGPLLATATNAAAVTLPISAHAIFRISALAASTFETLPFNGLIILTLNLSGCTHKEAYKPMFMMTVIFTLLGTIVAALLCMIPGLA